MTNEAESCPECQATLVGFPRTCAACGQDLGFPNVRLALRKDEIDALERRFEGARLLAGKKGVQREFEALALYAQSESQVVIAMSATTAIGVLDSDKSNYTNYDALVSSGARSTADYPEDAKRLMVSGSLFGTHGADIIYGALSLDGRGLPTYGDVYVTLKAVAIERRASFLQSNSYDFFDKFGNDSRPFGYRADWSRRGKLAAIKLMEEGQILPGQGEEEWAQLVLKSDGKNRNRDEFIEGHIYGPFNSYSIESLRPADEQQKHNRSLVDVAVKLFAERNRIEQL